MHDEQKQRARELLAQKGIDKALFANPHSVTWLTGYFSPPQVGPSAYAGGPPLVLYGEGEFHLVVLEGSPMPKDIPAVAYAGYSFQAPLAGREALVNTIRDLWSGSRGKVGIEADHLPFSLAPEGALPIDGWLEPLRRVKTAEELALLRRCFALTDIGHAAARQAIDVGKREIDIWEAAQTAIELAAGKRVAIGNDCVVSYRENNIGGWPQDLMLRHGDSLILDLSVILDGYWSDSCATLYTGEPSGKQKVMHQVVADTLAYAISLVKPGAISGEIDQKMRSFLDKAGFPDFPHHAGHGVGVSGHEEPRIVPYNRIPLEAGMVILLEPGIYFPRAAVRLEDAVLVTADGAEVLTQHNKMMP